MIASPSKVMTRQIPSPPVTDYALIEAQKENIRPLETGRSAAALSTLFDKDAEAILKEGHERFTKLVQDAEQRDQEGLDMPEGVRDLLDAFQQ
jgi:checkpoint serine/threonine-protein kinase